VATGVIGGRMGESVPPVHGRKGYSIPMTRIDQTACAYPAACRRAGVTSCSVG
jgi:hypothetical protein